MVIEAKMNGCSCCGKLPELAIVQRTGVVGKWYKMMCRNDNCPARLETEAFSTPEEAVENWNKENYR